MILNDRFYSVLKWLAVICLPALATCYNILASIWSLPYAEEISKTILAVSTLIGSLICISTADYYKDNKNGIQ